MPTAPGGFDEFVGTPDHAAESRCHVLVDVPTDVGLLLRVEPAVPHGAAGLPGGPDRPHGLGQRLLADGGDRDAGVPHRCGQVVGEIDVDFGHESSYNYNP